MTTLSTPAVSARESARRSDGRFGEQTRTDPGQLALADGAIDAAVPVRDWGSVDIPEGSRSKWGLVQEAIQRAPGIAIISTASHGGIKLSRERNAVIPAPLRTADGWYEEDAEEYIVGMHFPRAMGSDWLTSDDERRAVCEDKVRYWFTDGYEAATGQTVPAKESYSKQQAARETAEAQLRADN